MVPLHMLAFPVFNYTASVIRRLSWRLWDWHWPDAKTEVDLEEPAANFFVIKRANPQTRGTASGYRNPLWAGDWLLGSDEARHPEFPAPSVAKDLGGQTATVL